MEEKIVCKICGYSVDDSLQAHINRFHEMTVAKYQKKFPGSPIFSEKLRDISRRVNRNRDQSYRKKLSENTKRLYRDPVWTKKHNDALKRAQNRPETKKRHSEGAIRYFRNRTPEQIEERKKTMRKSWKDPQKRQNRVEGLKRGHRSEEGRRHHSEALKKYHKGLNKKQKKAFRENLRKTWAKPALRKKILVLSKIGLEKAMSPEGQRNRDLANLRPEVKAKRSRTAIKRMLKQPKISALNTKFKEALFRAGLKPKSEQKVGTFLVDFLFPKDKLVIEVDGDFWHANPSIYAYPEGFAPVQKRVVNKDKIEALYCKQNGFTLLRFWEQDINEDVDACINKVKETLYALRG